MVWELPKVREIPEIREIPKTWEFLRSENFPPVSWETGNSREFPAQGFPLSITDIHSAPLLPFQVSADSPEAPGVLTDQQM